MQSDETYAERNRLIEQHDLGVFVDDLVATHVYGQLGVDQDLRQELQAEAYTEMVKTVDRFLKRSGGPPLKERIARNVYSRLQFLDHKRIQECNSRCALSEANMLSSPRPRSLSPSPSNYDRQLLSDIGVIQGALAEQICRIRPTGCVDHKMRLKRPDDCFGRGAELLRAEEALPLHRQRTSERERLLSRYRTRYRGEVDPMSHPGREYAACLLRPTRTRIEICPANKDRLLHIALNSLSMERRLAIDASRLTQAQRERLVLYVGLGLSAVDVANIVGLVGERVTRKSIERGLEKISSIFSAEGSEKRKSIPINRFTEVA